jgi:hypothetical protein
MKKSGKMRKPPNIAVHNILHIFIGCTSTPVVVTLASMNLSQSASVRPSSLLWREREFPENVKTLGFIILPMPPMPPIIALICIIETLPFIPGYPYIKILYFLKLIDDFTE